jgi:RNA polymerase II subunit A-like phosphatase
VTPSEIVANGGGQDTALRSPLSKRKKLAAERTGYSKLKQAISADELRETTPSKETESYVVPVETTKESTVEDEDDEDDEEYEEDDDFLARELGGEAWG